MAKAMGARTKRTKARSTSETVRTIACALPGVEEGTSYGTPAWRVRKKLFARMWEDDVTLVLRVAFDTRDLLVEGDPDRFFLTDHYRPHPMVLIRLPRITPKALEQLIEESWRACASARQIAELRP